MDFVPDIAIPEKRNSRGLDITRSKNSKTIYFFLEGLAISLFFAFLITLGHIYLFDERVNARMMQQPWLLQRGFLQYTNIPDEHAPLLPQFISWVLPVFKGNAVHTMNVVYATLMFGSVFLSLFWLYLRYGRWAALAGGAFFVAYSTSMGYFSISYDLALSPVYLLTFFLLTAPEPVRLGKFAGRILLLGLAGGLAVLIKQHAVLALGVTFLWILYRCIRKHLSFKQLATALGLYAIGVLLPVAAYTVYFWSKGGQLADLFYWTVTFNLTGTYLDVGTLYPTAANVRAILPLFLLILPLLFSLFRKNPETNPGEKSTRFLLLAFLVVSVVLEYPRYSTMHWAPTLAFLAIGSGMVCNDLFQMGEKLSSGRFLGRSIYAAFTLFWLSALLTTYQPLLQRSKPRILTEYQPLWELSAQLKQQGLERANILIFPDNEEIDNLYYLLDTTPPKYWLMTYPWFMNDFTLTRWKAALEQEPPEYVLLFGERLDWSSNPDALAYLQARYQTISTLDWQGTSVQIMNRTGTISP